MISIIITSFKEPKTIGKAIESIARQKFGKYEIIVSAPDAETLAVAKKYASRNKRVKVLQDKGEGKPAALNMAIRRAKGSIVVLTDGDVYVGKDSINLLVAPFKDEKVGAVTGRPISSNGTDTQMGFWAYMLTEIAHRRRMKAMAMHRRFFCSGYLFAIRKSLFPRLDENLLSEDGYISHYVYSKGSKIAYVPDAEVYVRYPTNFSDWVKQKKRSAGGYSQIRQSLGISIRSFKSETFGGFAFFNLARSPKQLAWLISLFAARIYLWAAIYMDINIKKKSHKEIWQRIETTK